MLPFRCKWNSYSHIPKPLNLVPSLPTLYVPTLPDIHSPHKAHKLHTLHARYLGEGLKEKGGESTCFVQAWTYSVFGEIKTERIWSSE